VIWLIKGFFEDISLFLEDTARVDGCLRLEVLVKVILPLSWLSGCWSFSFIAVWNSFIFPWVLANERFQIYLLK